MPSIFSHAVAVGVAVAASVGLYVLVLFLYVQLGDGRKRGDYPFKDRYLREPGHTLEKNLRGLDQRVVLHCAVAAFLPLPAIEVLSRPGANVAVPWTAALTLAVFGLNCVGSVGVLRRFVRLRLGLAAERMTGQELEQSRVPGSKIFHDVPLERCGNVDHVVVAPAGVFAVETKAHRKPVPKIPDGYKVRKDGPRLQFPRYTDSRAIEQAQRQAQVLSRELRDSGFQPGKVRAVVALPGWCVLQNDPKEEVWVVNPKSLGPWIRLRPAVLTASEVNGMATFLDDRCRDVELE